MWFLETSKVISPYQSGFRGNRNSINHIVQMESRVRQEIAMQWYTLAVFFDIQKAYDTGWKYFIIIKAQQYGLWGHLIYYKKNSKQPENHS